MRGEVTTVLDNEALRCAEAELSHLAPKLRVLIAGQKVKLPHAAENDLVSR